MKIPGPTLRRSLPLWGAMLLAGLALPGRAASTASVEPPPWTLTTELRAKVGYDSSLFDRANSPGDQYAELTPVFRFTRRPAISALSVESYARAVAFAEWSEENFVDGSIKTRYRYPAEEDLLVSTEANVHAMRSHVANSEVGRRVREIDLGFSWESTFSVTGKTQLRGRLTGRRLDYDEVDLNVNETVGSGLGWVLTPHEKLQFEAGGDFYYRRSTPNRTGQATIRQTEPALTFRARGQFSPRISGQMYIGLTHSRYSGIMRHSEVDVIGGANVGWAITERRSLRVRADRRVYFSAEGDQATDSRVGVEFEQQLSHGLRFSLGAEAARTEYRREITYRHDRSYPFRATLGYAFTQRMSANLDCSWSRQTSDQDFRNFNRTIAGADFRYRF